MGKPQYLVSAPNKADEWKAFYIRTVDILEAVDISSESEENAKKGWKQLWMMFEGEDCQDPQTLIDNGTPQDQETLIRVPDAIQEAIKAEHFWHNHNEFFWI